MTERNDFACAKGKMVKFGYFEIPRDSEVDAMTVAHIMNIAHCKALEDFRERVSHFVDKYSNVKGNTPMVTVCVKGEYKHEKLSEAIRRMEV